jgi:hypothetical protein
MKMMCKCGNIEEIKTDKDMEKYEIINCEDGTAVLVCKSCNEAVFVNFKNK